MFKKIRPFAATLSLLTLLPTFAAFSADVSPSSEGEESIKLCPISGKPADPSITVVYEGITYAFSDEACLSEFNKARANSLYQKLGGKAAIDAAVESFYTKVLADERIMHFFDDVNMDKQRRRQKEFLAAAFGGPVPYAGKDLRKAHAHLSGLNESHFNAVAEDLRETLVELKLDEELITQVMTIAASTKDAVLNQGASSE